MSADVHNLPSRRRFVVNAPSLSLSPADRVAAAYDLVDRAEAPLRHGNEPISGYRLLARAALMSIRQIVGREGAAVVADQLAEELRSMTDGAA